MRVRFSNVARQELEDARTWFNHQRSGLGSEFVQEIRAAAQRIERDPLLYPVELEDVRKYVVKRFSYTLRYVLRPGLVYVVAVSHQHRDPDYWIDHPREP